MRMLPPHVKVDDLLLIKEPSSSERSAVKRLRWPIALSSGNEAVSIMTEASEVAGISLIVCSQY